MNYVIIFTYLFSSQISFILLNCVGCICDLIFRIIQVITISKTFNFIFDRNCIVSRVFCIHNRLVTNYQGIQT